MDDGPDPQRGRRSGDADRSGYLTIRQAPEELQIETTRNGSTESVRYLPAAANAKGTDELLGPSAGKDRTQHPLVTDINKQAITLEEVRSLDPPAAR